MTSSVALTGATFTMGEGFLVSVLLLSKTKSAINICGIFLCLPHWGRWQAPA